MFIHYQNHKSLVYNFFRSRFPKKETKESPFNSYFVTWQNRFNQPIVKCLAKMDNSSKTVFFKVAILWSIRRGLNKSNLRSIIKFLQKELRKLEQES